MNVYLLQAVVYEQTDDYEKAVISFQNYFNAYDRYKDGKLNTLELRMMVLSGCNEYEHDQQLLSMIHCLCKLKRFDEAHKYMNKIENLNRGFPLCVRYSIVEVWLYRNGQLTRR